MNLTPIRGRAVHNLRVLLLILLIVYVIITIPVVLISRNINRYSTSNIQHDGLVIAKSLTSVLNARIDSYRTLVESPGYSPGSYDEAYYREACRTLGEILEYTEADFIFTEKQVDDTTAMYILDGEDPSSESFSPVGTEDSISAVELEAFRTQEPQVTDLIDDPVWGEYITAFAPIIDKRDGTFLGLVGVDYSKESIEDVKVTLFWSLGIGMTLLIIILTALSYVIYLILQARHVQDHLTRLYNRAFLTKSLHRQVRKSRRREAELGLLMIDIDWFKQVNDREGHAAGDEVLVQVGRMLQHSTRPHDICSRYGGDEFVILLPACREEECRAVAVRILEHARTLHTPGGRAVTLSIGLTRALGGTTAEELLEQADLALYRAKELGRDRVAVFEHGIG